MIAESHAPESEITDDIQLSGVVILVVRESLARLLLRPNNRLNSAVIKSLESKLWEVRILEVEGS